MPSKYSISRQPNFLCEDGNPQSSTPTSSSPPTMPSFASRLWNNINLRIFNTDRSVSREGIELHIQRSSYRALDDTDSSEHAGSMEAGTHTNASESAANVTSISSEQEATVHPSEMSAAEGRRAWGTPTVSVLGLRKTHDSTLVVNHVHLDLYEHQIFALLGHNGAGIVCLITLGINAILFAYLFAMSIYTFALNDDQF